MLSSITDFSCFKLCMCKLPVKPENATCTITKQTLKPTLQLSHPALEEPDTILAGDGLKSYCLKANIVSSFHVATYFIDFFFFHLIFASFSEMFPFVLLLYRTKYKKVPIVYQGLSALK